MRIVLSILIALVLSSCKERDPEPVYILIDSQNCIDACFRQLMEHLPERVDGTNSITEIIRMYREECKGKAEKYSCYQHIDTLFLSSYWEYEIADKRKIRRR